MNHSISTADALAESLAQRCARPRRTRTGWQACCPAHEDRTPSLSITPQDEKVLLYCHAGCTAEAMVAALGLAMRDLFVTATRPSAPGRPRIVCTYPYHDADGQVVFEVVRYAPKKFKQRQPDPLHPGQWIWKRPTTYVLYHLPEVLRAVAAGETVYLCEGEKDAKNVRELGLTATCNPNGAGKWEPQYTTALHNARVVLLPDNDPAGRHHTAVVTRALAGVAARVTVLELPGLAEQGDVSDWLQAGGTRAQLEALVAAAPAWAPAARPRFQTISAQELYAKPLPELEYAIPEILPVGATLFTGRGKDGKSLLVWNLCLAIATGGKALGRYPVQHGAVLYLALEDGERRAKKRLQEHMDYAQIRTPPERLELVLWDAPRIGEGFEAALTTWLDEHADARLVVVDILEKVRPTRSRNGSVYADDYAALAPLQRLAHGRNIAILIVHHANKTKPDDFRDTASGSMGLIGACDTFWSLQRLAGQADAALHIIGRDVNAQELALEFKDGFWTVLGDADAYRRSQASQAVLQALHEAGKPLTPKQLTGMLHVPEGTLRSRLSRMAERGELLNIGENRYIPRSCSPPLTPEQGSGGKQTPATSATSATGATEATLTDGASRSGGPVAGAAEQCNGGATGLRDGKDRQLDAVRCPVAGVAPSVTECLSPATGDPKPNGIPQGAFWLAASRGGYACPACGAVDWRLGVTYRQCVGCGSQAGEPPADMLGQREVSP